MKTPKWPLCLNAFLWPWDLMWCHQWTQNCPCIRIWSNILKVNICGQFDLTSGLFLKGNCIWAACSMLRERKGSGLGRLQKGRAVVKALLLSWCTCIVRTEPLWRVWFQCLWVLNHCDVWFQYMWELNHCDACDFSTFDNWTIVMCDISVHVRIEPLWCVWFQYMWELNHCDACDFSTCDNWTIVMCVISVHDPGGDEAIAAQQGPPETVRVHHWIQVTGWWGEGQAKASHLHHHARNPGGHQRGQHCIIL